jgi:hypothetical protein
MAAVLPALCPVIMFRVGGNPNLIRTGSLRDLDAWAALVNFLSFG